MKAKLKAQKLLPAREIKDNFETMYFFNNLVNLLKRKCTSAN